jgi:group I intron endonuclease
MGCFFVYICIMQSGIYYIKHIDSGKIYVGQSENIDRRIKAHKNWFANPTRIINRHLYNYAKKYPLECFEFGILEFCELESLDERELYWYTIHKRNSFNVRPEPVSNRGIKRTEEFCSMISEIKKKQYESEEMYERYIAGIKRRSENNKWVESIKNSAKKRADDPEWRKKNLEMSKSQDVINKKKISNFTKGLSRAVAQYTLDDIFVDYFISAGEAAKMLNVRSENISTCLKGRMKSAYGFKWKYLTNEEYLDLNGGEIIKKT